MIRIGKSLTELDKLAQDHWNLVNKAPFDLTKKIAKHNKRNQYEIALFRQLNSDIKKIIVARPEQLQKLIEKIQPLYQKVLDRIARELKAKKKTKEEINSAQVNYKDDLLKLFDYNKFIASGEGKYAYNHTNKLEVNVCLYCNRQYTFTIFNLKKKNTNSVQKKTRPQIDHFFDKATYPYLALSFYNLIPSCPTCNAGLKHTASFSYKNNLHPFVESADDVMRFSTGLKTSSDYVSGSIRDFDIILKYDPLGEKKLKNKTDNNMQTFLIEQLYNQHKDYAGEIIRKAYYYNNSRIKELEDFEYANGKKLFNNRNEIMKFITGNYLAPDELNRRPLAKLTKDIAEELRLL